MNIGTAIGKPFTNAKALVIGIILGLIPIVNVLTVPGYLLKVANKTMTKDNAMPEWSDFGKIIVDSIKLIITSIVWLIPLAIVLIILAFIFGIPQIILQLITEMATGGATASEVAASQIAQLIVSALAFAAISAVVLIVWGFAVTSAVMNFAKTNRWGAAFKIGEITRNALKAKFILAVIIAAVIVVIIQLVLTAIPYAGWILLMLAAFPLEVFSYSLIAESYA